MRASPLKVLPTPIPAWAAVPRDLEGGDADGSCSAAVTVLIAEIAGNAVVDDGDEVEVVEEEEEEEEERNDEK